MNAKLSAGHLFVSAPDLYGAVMIQRPWQQRVQGMVWQMGCVCELVHRDRVNGVIDAEKNHSLNISSRAKKVTRWILLHVSFGE